MLSLKAKLAAIAAAILLIVGTFYLGSYIGYQRGVNVAAVEIQRYQIASQRLQQAIQKAQTQVNERVVVQYKDRVSYIDRVVYKTKTVVEQSVPEQFSLSRGWIYAYNQSVLGLELDPTKASDATPSSVSEMRALSNTIAPNNGICLSNKAKADALQAWITQTEAARAKETR